MTIHLDPEEIFNNLLNQSKSTEVSCYLSYKFKILTLQQLPKNFNELFRMICEWYFLFSAILRVENYLLSVLQYEISSCVIN